MVEATGKNPTASVAVGAFVRSYGIPRNGTEKCTFGRN